MIQEIMIINEVQKAEIKGGVNRIYLFISLKHNEYNLE